MNVINFYRQMLSYTRFLDGLPALGLRLILAPVMIIAGFNKLQFSNEDIGLFAQFTADPSIVQWFGNAEWGLGLPFPEVLANLAAWTEFLGGWFILFGLLTRLVSLPLMFTMFIAAASVHLDNGWYAIAPTNADTSPSKVFHWLGFEQASQSMENATEVKKRITAIKSLLDEHGNTDWLYEKGNVVVLNNGIEFAATYFVMFLTLFFIGGGRFVSVDYWFSLYLNRQSE